MRILLVNPPIKNLIDSEVPSVVSRGVGVFPPLGLMYLASYIKRYNKYEVRILDAIAESMGYQEIQKYIREYQPQLIGITAHTHNLLDVIAVAKIAKEVNEQIHITVGGAQARIFPQETIEIPNVDSVVIGEGEITFAELSEAIDKKRGLQEIKGLIFKENGRAVETGLREEIKNLDILPFPDRNMINSRHYYYIVNKKVNMTTMLSSRGCPYHCSFCSTPRYSYRVRSPENVVDEIEECLNFSVKEIHFVDDTFNVFPARVVDICEEILKRKLKFRWSFRGRADTVTREMLVKLKESGCERIHFGVETSTNKGLKRIKKGITIEQIKRVFKWTRQVGIATVAYFMIGCPHERNSEDILNTIEFAIQIDPDFALFNVLTVYPGTELYNEGLRREIFKGDPWGDFVRQPRSDFAVPVWKEQFCREELFSLLNLAYRKFYLRPKFILRTIHSIRSFKGFIKKLKAGIKICKLPDV
jgi:radical SAM superfamily enzyme YgiQ (UPF0313 family)